MRARLSVLEEGLLRTEGQLWAASLLPKVLPCEVKHQTVDERVFALKGRVLFGSV